MGQKVNPIGFRTAVHKEWKSRWFAERKDFGDLLNEDLLIRDMVQQKLKDAAVADIHIERYAQRARVTVFTARPGVVIGRKGEGIDQLREELAKKTGKEIYVEIKEVRNPDANAQLVAENIALQIERRVAFRRAMKRALQLAMDMGAQGIRVQACGGWVALSWRAPSITWSARCRCRRCALMCNTVLRKRIRWPAKSGLSVGFASSRKRLPRPAQEKFYALMPKRVKYRQSQRGSRKGMAMSGNTLAFGEYGLRAMERAWITNIQIEAARVAMNREMKRKGKLWIRIFPDKSYSKKPLEVRMGKGKGAIEGWVAVVRPGRILFEIDGVPEALAVSCMRLAATKLPIRTTFVRRGYTL